MKQYAEHDRVGICHALRRDDMYVRTFSGGYPYFKNGVLLRSSSLEPIYSYGKNYAKNKQKFALFVWTTDNDEAAVEKRFKALVKDISKEKVAQVADDGSFTYLD